MAEENALAQENPEIEAPAPEAEAPETETPETDTPAEEAAGEDTPTPQVDEAPDPAALQADIEELKRQKEEAKEKAIYWRKQKAESRADFFKGNEGGDQPQPQQPAPVDVGPEPQANDFDDYNEFVKALTDHRVKAARAGWEAEQSQAKAQAVQQQRAESLQQKMQEGFSKYDDFESVAFDPTATHITPMVVDILADCDNAADVAYHLARDRVEGVKISRMTPGQAAMAIARIDASYSNPDTPAAGKKAPPKKHSSAPAPIRPVGAGPAGPSRDPDKMSPKEFAKWREEQGARRF